eukprot:m.286404 g.286404  ORF g.286404 m.286404 type:complete len:243 (+) comp19930_c0_seq1:1326-2054(+)
MNDPQLTSASVDARADSKELHFFDRCMGVTMPRSSDAIQLAKEDANSDNWCDAVLYDRMLQKGRNKRNERRLQELERHREEASREAESLADHILVGEASPSYMLFPEIPSLMKLLYPQVKVVLMLREPVARAYSGYFQTISSWSRTDGRPLNFSEAIGVEYAIIKQCEALYGHTRTDPVSFMNPTTYTECIWPWFATESLERTLHEEFVGNRNGGMLLVGHLCPVSWALGASVCFAQPRQFG